MLLLKAFLKDESGAAAIEYGLIAAGVSLAIIGVMNGFGFKLKAKFTSISPSGSWNVDDDVTAATTPSNPSALPPPISSPQADLRKTSR